MTTVSRVERVPGSQDLGPSTPESRRAFPDMAGRRGFWPPVTPATVSIAVLIFASGIYLTWLSRDLWFLLDDWAFLLHREVTLTGETSLLQPHNEHWVTLPILVFRLLFQVVGLQYLPYALVTIGLHLGVCVLFALVLRRSGADPWVCVLMTSVLAFYGPGGTNILWDFQMSFVAPSALALACLLLIDRGATLPRFPVTVWVMLAAALMCSGAGITMVAWVSAYAWQRRGLRCAFVVGLPTAVPYLIWYAAYGRGNSPAPPAPPEQVLPYVVRGITNLWSTVVPIPWLGMVVLVLITAATLMARQHRRLRAQAAAGLMALVFNYLLLGVARAGLGLDQATSTRYLYVGVLLTLPAVGLSLQLLWERLDALPRPRAVIWLVLGVTFIGSGAQLLAQVADGHEEWVSGSRGRLVAAAALVEQGAPLLSQRVEPIVAPDIDVASLSRPDVRDRMPRVEPTPGEVLAVASHLQVGVSADTLGLPPARRVVVRGVLSTSQRGECQRLEVRSGAVVVVPATATGSEIALMVAAGQIFTELQRAGLASPRWEHDVPAGTTLHVGTVAPDAQLRITLPSGDLTLCGGGDVVAER